MGEDTHHLLGKTRRLSNQEQELVFTLSATATNSGIGSGACDLAAAVPISRPGELAGPSIADLAAMQPPRQGTFQEPVHMHGLL